MADDDRTYDVFISYRSSRSPDSEIAERLQRALEDYGVPRSLRHALVRPGRFGWPSRLRVFRDNSDLSATPDLWQAIRDRLLNSRWLVVVCSPATPESPWVAREIETFIAAHGRERVIAVLVEGEPDESIPIGLRSEAFDTLSLPDTAAPGARPIVPRAADLRAPDVRSAAALLNGRRTPRTRQQQFDVLAPILGLSSRDQLVQRHRARVRRQRLWTALGVLLVVTGVSYFKSREDAARARVREADAKAAEAEAKRIAESARADAFKLDKEASDLKAAEARAREVVERDQRISETAKRGLAQAHRHQFADPFTAAAEIYQSTRARMVEGSDAAMHAIHAVLLERRAIAIREALFIRHGPFSFSPQSNAGEKTTTPSRDGQRVLVVIPGDGEQLSPKIPGDAAVLDNRTSQLKRLDSCKTPQYRLEFAGFLGTDKVVVGRAFHVDTYTITGSCVASFQLLKTKTAVTVVTGMLGSSLLVAGNGAGCVWVAKYGGSRFVEPSRALGVVENCDDRQRPNAVTQLLSNTSGELGILVFQSGRMDVFGFDEPGGRARRRAVVKTGGRAVAFQDGSPQSTFAVSHRTGRSEKLELWDPQGPKPRPVRPFSLAAVDHPIDFLGFPEGGRMLIGVDASCALHYWDTGTGAHLLSRPGRDLPCVAAGT